MDESRLYSQPYVEAVEECMERLPDTHQDERGQEEDELERLEEKKRKGHPRHVHQTCRMISMSFDGSEVVGTSLSGNEVLRMPAPEPGALAGDLKVRAAQALGVRPVQLALLVEERPLGDSESVCSTGSFVLKVTHVHPTVFVCRRSRAQHAEPSLGEGTVVFRLPGEPSAIQGLQEPRAYVTMDEGLCWLVYSKDGVSMAACGRDEPVVPVGIFPAPPAWALPEGCRQWGGARCDVWSASLELPRVEPLLSAHAASTNDRPIPRYQMVVDPNLFAREGAAGVTWVPCEFDVGSDGSARLVGGERSHAHPGLASEVARPVLEAALPLLARLQRPRLLLDRRRLQVVFKAQRILVPPKVSEGSDSEYVGLWHVDGRLEHVAAVVLYYYRADPALQGGDMEFCGREPMDVLGIGDCSNNFERLSGGSLREALRRPADDTGETVVQNCRVPVRKGTLLVFSNYQMVHRVLRMVNTGSQSEASRDFVALFVIDPAAEPLVTARSHLARPYMLGRTLKAAAAFAPPAVRTVLEFAGEVLSDEQLRKRRAQLLWQQLQPSGQFIGNDSVYATGNGCYVMIGWLRHMLEDGEPGSDGADMIDEQNPKGWSRFQALNLAPKRLGRGMSEVLSLPSSQLSGAWREARRLEEGAKGGLLPDGETSQTGSGGPPP